MIKVYSILKPEEFFTKEQIKKHLIDKKPYPGTWLGDVNECLNGFSPESSDMQKEANPEFARLALAIKSGFLNVKNISQRTERNLVEWFKKNTEWICYRPPDGQQHLPDTPEEAQQRIESYNKGYKQGYQQYMYDNNQIQESPDYPNPYPRFQAEYDIGVQKGTTDAEIRLNGPFNW